MDGEREAQLHGKKREDNWVRVALYAATLAAAFVVGGYLASWMGLLLR